MNLGFVNTGDGVARIRIRSLAAGGEQTGGVFEWSIPEADSWVMVDVEGRLGVSLDGSVTIETEVLEGRAAGYVSIIDGLTGIQQTLPAFRTIR